MTFFMAGEGRRQYGQTVPSELRDKFAMSMRQPLGVCAVITPWNFPMAIPSWKIIPALVCGNTVVFKPASLTPLSALNFVKILDEAGIPRGVVNLVTGGGGDVGNAMLVSDTVRIVSFTGSTDVGRTVSSQAAPSFKKVHLEMGGKNVIMILDDANLKLAVVRVVAQLEEIIMDDAVIVTADTQGKGQIRIQHRRDRRQGALLQAM